VLAHGSRDRRLWIALMVALAGSCVAVVLAEDEPHRMDRQILLAMREKHDRADPIGPAELEQVARDVTALGGSPLVLTLTVTACGYLVLRRRWLSASVVVVSVMGGEIASDTIKAIVDRPRPDLVPRFVQVYSASFPSGHAFLAMVVYLTIAMQLARLEKAAVVRGYLIAIALVIVAAVGISRIYLGVHWPSDVLAGWGIGLAWVLVVWAAARVYERGSSLARP
jgi:undecaprenyl-diphosphatase